MEDDEREEVPPRTPPPRGYGDNVWYNDHKGTKRCLTTTFREGMFCQPLEHHDDDAKKKANDRYDEILVLTKIVLQEGNFTMEVSPTTNEGRKIRGSVARDWRKRVLREWPDYQKIPKAWLERYSVWCIQHVRENERAKVSSKTLRATRKHSNPNTVPSIAPSSSGALNIQTRSSSHSNLTSAPRVPPFIVGNHGRSAPVMAPRSSEALNLQASSSNNSNLTPALGTSPPAPGTIPFIPVDPRVDPNTILYNRSIKVYILPGSRENWIAGHISSTESEQVNCELCMTDSSSGMPNVAKTVMDMELKKLISHLLALDVINEGRHLYHYHTGGRRAHKMTPVTSDELFRGYLSRMRTEGLEFIFYTFEGN